VSKSFQVLDDQFDARLRRKTVFELPYQHWQIDETKFGTVLYQAEFGLGLVEWECRADWQSLDTDITSMQVVPATPGAEVSEKQTKYLEWQMLPPPVGSWVSVFGLPPVKIKQKEDHHSVEYFVHREVVEVFPVARDCGMTRFPGFRLDRSFEHGMSGAAVVYANRLVGIFSGPDYVAGLWPLAVHQHRLLETGAYVNLSGMFDSGEIQVSDWADVKGRVERKPCTDATGREYPCGGGHVVLNR
jgi:hypothetical protein